MTHNTYSASVSVHKDWLDTEKDEHFDAPLVIDAENIENAREKIMNFFENQDVPGVLEHKIVINIILNFKVKCSVIPKILFICIQNFL